MEAPGTADATALHASYALPSGYVPLLKSIGRGTVRDIEQLPGRFTAVGDAGDPRDSLAHLFGLHPFTSSFGGLVTVLPFRHSAASTGTPSWTR
jgi:hypothetical protein